MTNDKGTEIPGMAFHAKSKDRDFQEKTWQRLTEHFAELLPNSVTQAQECRTRMKKSQVLDDFFCNYISLGCPHWTSYYVRNINPKKLSRRTMARTKYRNRTLVHK